MEVSPEAVAAQWRGTMEGLTPDQVLALNWLWRAATGGNTQVDRGILEHNLGCIFATQAIILSSEGHGFA